MIYRIVLGINDFLYRKNIRKSEKAQVPTICVGNISAGGTGKTPHTEMILNMLKDTPEWRSRRLAMLSRGYKRKSRGFQIVNKEGSARYFGDEPLQIKKNCPQATVAVCKNRLEGCKKLKEEHGAELVVLDDAFQYRKLKADVNVILVNWNKPIFSDALLPWGHLRDLPRRIREADIVIVTKCPFNITEEARNAFCKKLGFKEWKGKVFFTMTSYLTAEPVFDGGDRHYLYSKRAVLFSAIASDKPLYRSLCSNYKVVARFRFRDHHRFTRANIREILSAAKSTDIAGIFTTQKDAQRLLDCKKVPDIIKSRTFYVPIEPEFMELGEKEEFLQTLLSKLG